MKRTALKAKPRSKGSRGELAVIDIYKAHGWPARRNWMSGGKGGADIIGGPPGTSTECKHQEEVRMKEWILQCERAAKPTDIPIVAHRINRESWQAVVPKNDFEDLWLRVGQPARKARYGCAKRVALWKWIHESREEAGPLPPLLFFSWQDASFPWYANLELEDLCSLLKAAER